MMECPFCGVPTDAPHETQQGCIAALHAEISRMRGVLACVRSAEVPGPEFSGESSDDGSARGPGEDWGI
jgi:hypothetical protein